VRLKVHVISHGEVCCGSRTDGEVCPRRRQLSPEAAIAPLLDDAALPAASRIAWAQAYPARPVRVVVGNPVGSATDRLARVMSQWLSERLGRPFFVENRPGAGSNIAAEAVAHAPPDGYTLLLVGATNATNATLYERLNFNFIRDIAPVAGIMRAPFVMEVTPSFRAQTVPRVHRLCQGQSKKDQHGLRRDWERQPNFR
jgi:tripartite-type tricarboxylate transporter receptor subunit TctC